MKELLVRKMSEDAEIETKNLKAPKNISFFFSKGVGLNERFFNELAWDDAITKGLYLSA